VFSRSAIEACLPPPPPAHRFSLRQLRGDDPVAEFACGPRDGAAAIDAYLRQQALTDQRARLNTVWVAVESLSAGAPGSIVGFFSLSPLSIPISSALLTHIEMPTAPYASADGYLLGRLGVAAHMQGQRFGDVLIFAALRIARAVGREAGGAFVAVDPKNDALVGWYERLGFHRLDPIRRRMVHRLP
jgi:ribosomal protein S18 acetylase RimI-like enzyme